MSIEKNIERIADALEAIVAKLNHVEAAPAKKSQAAAGQAVKAADTPSTAPATAAATTPAAPSAPVEPAADKPLTFVDDFKPLFLKLVTADRPKAVELVKKYCGEGAKTFSEEAFNKDPAGLLAEVKGLLTPAVVI